MNIKKWAEKNRILEPDVKELPIKHLVVEGEKLFDESIYPKACLELLFPAEREAEKFSSERINPSGVMLKRKSPLPEKLICVSNPIDDPPLFKQQYLGEWKTKTTPEVLVDIREQRKATGFTFNIKNSPEKQFEKDFNNHIAGKIIVEDISMHPSIILNAIDRAALKVWIDQWISNHGDLSENFKYMANDFLEQQFNR